MTKLLWWIGGAVAAVLVVVIVKRKSAPVGDGRWVDQDWSSPGGELSTRYVRADGQQWGASYTEPDPNAGTWKAYHLSGDPPMVDKELVATSKNQLALMIDKA